MSITTRINSIIDNLKNAYTSLENKNATIPEDKNIENLANTIESIEVGSSIKEEIEWKDVVFIDFDGTPLYSYTMEEVQELTELPPLPTREGFTYQGWNWSLEDIKVQNDGAIVGAHCVTSDGITRLYLDLDEPKSILFGLCQNKANAFKVDWGDEASELSGSVVGTSSPVNLIHEYTNAGKHIISITPLLEDTELYFNGDSSSGYVLRKPNVTNSWILAGGFAGILKKIELGEKVEGIYGRSFYPYRCLETINIPIDTKVEKSPTFRDCNSLKSLVIPNGTTSLSTYGMYYNGSMETVSLPATLTSIGSYFFGYNSTLRHLRVPNTAKSIGTYACNYNYNLKRFAIPEGVTSIPNYCFYYNHNLLDVKIPSTVTSIGTNSFYRCFSLKRLVFPGNITSIGSAAFDNCKMVEYYDFTNCTSVPTLSATTAFSGISTKTKIIVPDTLYDEWIVATNWSTYKSYIVKESEYNA